MTDCNAIHIISLYRITNSNAVSATCYSLAANSNAGQSACCSAMTNSNCILSSSISLIANCNTPDCASRAIYTGSNAICTTRFSAMTNCSTVITCCTCILAHFNLSILGCRVSCHCRNDTCASHHACSNQHCQQLFGRTAFTAHVFGHFGYHNVGITGFTPDNLIDLIHTKSSPCAFALRLYYIQHYTCRTLSAFLLLLNRLIITAGSYPYVDDYMYTMRTQYTILYCILRKLYHNYLFITRTI